MSATTVTSIDDRRRQKQVALSVRACERRSAALVQFTRSLPLGYTSWTRDNLIDVLGVLPYLQEFDALVRMAEMRAYADEYEVAADSQDYDEHEAAAAALDRLESAARDAVAADVAAAGAV